MKKMNLDLLCWSVNNKWYFNRIFERNRLEQGIKCKDKFTKCPENNLGRNNSAFIFHKRTKR